MQNGKPVLQVIQVGLSDGRNTQVISGLNPGETVVIGSGSGFTSAAGAIGNGGRPGGGGPPLGGRGFGG